MTAAAAQHGRFSSACLRSLPSGLAHEVLRRAMRDGTHHLIRWETDWSSQTGACQAGLLHGNNHDIPAFRWWKKDRGAAIVTNHPRDAAETMHRVLRGWLAHLGQDAYQ